MTDQSLDTASFAPLDRHTRGPSGHKAAILEVIKTGPMTAEEVAARSGIRAASARLSELLRDGYVTIANDKRRTSNGKSVLVYEFVPDPQRTPNLGKQLKKRFADGK